MYGASVVIGLAERLQIEQDDFAARDSYVSFAALAVKRLTRL